MNLIQYDMFEAPDPNAEIKAQLQENKESIRKTQRRFFAENKNLIALIIKQQKEIDDLNNRITRLMK